MPHPRGIARPAPPATRTETALIRYQSTESQPWRLVQIANLLRRSHALHRSALSILAGVSAGIPSGDTVELDACDMAEIERLGAEIADLTSQLQLLSDTLTAGPTTISTTALRTDAQRALAAGSFDPHITLLAARALTAEDGWPALASALRCTDAHTSWHAVTAARLVTAFRNTDERVVARTMADAALDADLELSACNREEVARLARALEDNADNHR